MRSERADLLAHLRVLVDQALAVRLGRFLELLQDALVLAGAGDGRLTGEGLHAPRARRDALLGGDEEEADVTGLAHVRAAAELLRESGDLDHAYALAVLVAEEGEGAGGERLLAAHDARLHGRVAEDLLVHAVLDVGQLARSHPLVVAEVEAEAVRRHQAARLLDVRAQGFAQGRVQQVGAGVVAHGARTQALVHLDADGHAALETAGRHLDVVHVEAGHGLMGVHHVRGRALRGDDPVVADLPAGLSVERRLVEDDLTRFPLVEARGELPVLQHGQHARLFVRERVVPDELRRALLEQAHVERIARDRAHLRGLPGPLALALQLALEPFAVDRELVVLRQLFQEVDGQAVGVVEPEGVRAGDDATLARAAQLLDRLAQLHHGLLQRGPEALFLGAHDARDGRRLRAQLRIGARHAVHHRGDELVEERLLDAELLAVPHRAPHDLAQHVAAPFVARHHAVADEEGHGAEVVGHDAEGDVAFRALFVGRARPPRYRLDDRLEEVGVVVGPLPLDDGSDPLEAHAGVHAGGGERTQLARRIPVVLHEHEVPDLEPAVALALDAQALPPRLYFCAGQVVALEEVDLRARAAGPGLAHGPEVLFRAQLQDAVRADVREPEAVRLRVARHAAFTLEDRDLQAVLGEPEVARQQLPRVGDGFLLEVVAEGEVAQHLEEGVVPRGATDVLEVVVLATRPHAFLGRGRARVVALLLAQEHVLELVHPGVGEEQGGVTVRDERRAGHHAVAPLLEIAQEGGPYLVPCHRFLLLTGHGLDLAHDPPFSPGSSPPPSRPPGGPFSPPSGSVFGRFQSIERVRPAWPERA